MGPVPRKKILHVKFFLGALTVAIGVTGVILLLLLENAIFSAGTPVGVFLWGMLEIGLRLEAAYATGFVASLVVSNLALEGFVALGILFFPVCLIIASVGAGIAVSVGSTGIPIRSNVMGYQSELFTIGFMVTFVIALAVVAVIQNLRRRRQSHDLAL